MPYSSERDTGRLGLEPFDDAAQALPWQLPPPPARTLKLAADKADERRFTGEAITAFGDLDAWAVERAALPQPEVSDSNFGAFIAALPTENAA